MLKSLLKTSNKELGVVVHTLIPALEAEADLVYVVYTGYPGKQV